MKAMEVIKLLQIIRPALCSYVKRDIVKVTELPNSSYNIMRKEVGDVVLPADRGFVFDPIKISF